MENKLSQITREELESKYIDLTAEYANYRKRTQNELDSASRKAEGNAFAGLMAMYDNMQRMFVHTISPKEVDFFIKSFREELSKRHFAVIDDKFMSGVKRYEDYASCISTVRTDCQALDGKVKDVFSCGLYDEVTCNVVLYAKVTVYQYSNMERQ